MSAIHTRSKLPARRPRSDEGFRSRWWPFRAAAALVVATGHLEAGVYSESIADPVSSEAIIGLLVLGSDGEDPPRDDLGIPKRFDGRRVGATALSVGVNGLATSVSSRTNGDSERTEVSNRPRGMEGWIVLGYALSGFALGAGMVLLAVMRRGRGFRHLAGRRDVGIAFGAEGIGGKMGGSLRHNGVADALSEFTQEARAPLNAIAGAADMLMGAVTDDERRDLARGIRADAVGALLSLRDANEFARLRAEAVALDCEPFDLPDLLESIVTLHAGIAERVGVGLILRMDSDASLALKGDRNRLRRALIEIFGRAARRAEGSEVCLHVSTIHLDKRGERARLNFVVAQRGDEVRFADNERPEESSSLVETTTKVDLGLQLVDRLARSFGGRFEIRAASKGRLEFVFQATFARVERSIAARSKPCPTIEELQGAALWIIAPRALTRDAVVGFAKALGMRPERLGSVSEAVSRARRTRAMSRVVLFIDGVDATDLEQANLASSVAELSALGGAALTWRAQASASEGRTRATRVVHLGARPLTNACFFEGLVALMDARAVSGESLAATQRSPERLGSVPRILLVEDHPVNRRLGLMLLKSLGLTASVANNGADAVAAVAEGDFDLALMDCEMPIMNGYEATRRIRRFDKARQPIIIAVTANTGAGERERCLSAGMNDYLQKPLRLAEFRAALMKHGLLASDDTQKSA